jgi:hypothetical protein
MPGSTSKAFPGGVIDTVSLGKSCVRARPTGTKSMPSLTRTLRALSPMTRIPSSRNRHSLPMPCSCVRASRRNVLPCALMRIWCVGSRRKAAAIRRASTAYYMRITKHRKQKVAISTDPVDAFRTRPCKGSTVRTPRLGAVPGSARERVARLGRRQRHLMRGQSISPRSAQRTGGMNKELCAPSLSHSLRQVMYR